MSYVRKEGSQYVRYEKNDLLNTVVIKIDKLICDFKTFNNNDSDEAIFYQMIQFIISLNLDDISIVKILEFKNAIKKVFNMDNILVNKDSVEDFIYSLDEDVKNCALLDDSEEFSISFWKKVMDKNINYQEFCIEYIQFIDIFSLYLGLEYQKHKDLLDLILKTFESLFGFQFSSEYVLRNATNQEIADLLKQNGKVLTVNYNEENKVERNQKSKKSNKDYPQFSNNEVRFEMDQEEASSFFRYEVIKNEVHIIKYIGKSSKFMNLRLPDYIQGLPVTYLEEFSIIRLNHINCMFLPKTIKTLGTECFFMTKIDHLFIPSSLESVEDMIFLENQKKTKIYYEDAKPRPNLEPAELFNDDSKKRFTYNAKYDYLEQSSKVSVDLNERDKMYHKFDEGQYISEDDLTRILSKYPEDRELRLRLLKYNPQKIRKLDNKYKNDLAFIFDAIDQNVFVYLSIRSQFKTNTEVIRRAIRSNGMIIKEMQREGLSDDLLLEAIKSNPIAISWTKYSGRGYLKEKKLALSMNGYAILHLHKAEIIDNPELLIMATEQNPVSLVSFLTKDYWQSIYAKVSSSNRQKIEKIYHQETLKVKNTVENDFEFLKNHHFNQGIKEWMKLASKDNAFLTSIQELDELMMSNKQISSISMIIPLLFVKYHIVPQKDISQKLISYLREYTVPTNLKLMDPYFSALWDILYYFEEHFYPIINGEMGLPLYHINTLPKEVYRPSFGF